MRVIRSSLLSESEKLEIIELWNNEYPEKLAYSSVEEFNNYLNGLTDPLHILLVDEGERIRGWYFDFKRNNEKWFALILDSVIQGKGFGSKLLELAKSKESELNGWVIDHDLAQKRNGEKYKSPLGFYLKNGFEILPENRLELDKISAVKIKWKMRSR